MTFRAVVDGAPLSVPWTGVARYVAGVLREAAEASPADADVSVVRYAPRRSMRVDPAHSLDPRVDVRDASLLRSRAMSGCARIGLHVPFSAFTRGDVDVLTRYWGSGGRRPQVTFVYDLVWRAAPETVERGYLSRLTRLADRAIAEATTILVMSNAVRAELAAAYPGADARAVVVPPAPAVLATVDVDEARRRVADVGIAKPFVLFVGTIEPRKNLDRLLDAWPAARRELGDVDLVVAGSDGWSSDQTRGRIGAMSHVIRVRPRDGVLAALYATARAVVLPSIYEGFGLTVEEALLAGAPVACSDIPVLREVSGGAADLFDPRDPALMADAIVRAATRERAIRSTAEDRRGVAGSRFLAAIRAAHDSTLP